MKPSEIKDFRESLDLKPGKFGALLGLRKRSNRTVESWESGECEISGPCAKLIKLAQRLGPEILN